MSEQSAGQVQKTLLFLFPGFLGLDSPAVVSSCDQPQPLGLKHGS